MENFKFTIPEGAIPKSDNSSAGVLEDVPPVNELGRADHNTIIEQHVEDRKAERALRKKYAGLAFRFAVGGALFWAVILVWSGWATYYLSLIHISAAFIQCAFGGNLMADDNLNTAAGCRLAIGGKTGADSETKYKADTYVQVGEIEDLGEFGDTFSAVNFTALSDGRVRKYKGTADAGNMTLTVGLDSGDAGQKAVAVAHKDRSKGNYNVKVTLNDGDPDGTPAILPTTFYFGVKVMNNTVAPGAADNVVRRNMTFAINTDIIEIPAGPAAP